MKIIFKLIVMVLFVAIINSCSSVKIFNLTLESDRQKERLISWALNSPFSINEIFLKQRERDKSVNKNQDAFLDLPFHIDSSFANESRSHKIGADSVIFLFFKDKLTDESGLHSNYQIKRSKKEYSVGKNKVMYFDEIIIYSNNSDYALSFRWQYYCNDWYFTGLNCWNTDFEPYSDNIH